LELLLVKKLMDLEATSPRTAETKISIRDSLVRKITQQVVGIMRRSFGAMVCDLSDLRLQGDQEIIN
jgi:hypothetical protein